MFCDKCGAQLAEGTKFCGSCGNVIVQPEQPVQQPVYQQPVQPAYQQPAQPVYQQPVQPAYQQPAQPVAVPMTRGKFISSAGGPKGLALGSMLILFLCAILIGVCLYATLFGSLSDLPALNMIATLAGGDMDDFDAIFEDGQDTMEQARKELEDAIEGRELSRDEEEAVELAEELLDKGEEAMEKKSISGLRDVLNAIVEVDDQIEELDIGYAALDGSDRDEIESIGQAMDVVIIVFVVMYGIGILLAVLAGIFKNNVLTVFALLSSFGLCATCGNALLAVLLLVLFIVAIVLNSKITGQYKTYKRSLGFYT